MAFAYVPNRNVIDSGTASKTQYDVLVVGSGVSGAIIANELSRQGRRVLIIEAGLGRDFTIPGYERYLLRFYSAVSKDNNAPFPNNRNARIPRSPETRALVDGRPDSTGGYFVQNGPFPLESSYAKVVGGTTLHWQGSTPRMMPDDFEMFSRYGQGRDWPFNYDTIEPYYRKAERELGVSGDVASQARLGIPFVPGYVYPMQEIPHSYLDRQVDAGLKGKSVKLDGQDYLLAVSTIPQARNGVPNPQYDGGEGYDPVGAVNTHQALIGVRCQGNNNCVPLCPIQAKYDARKTLAKALQTGRVDLLNQTVASQVCVDRTTGRVSKIICKQYESPDRSHYEIVEFTARLYVVAANAIETPRLMLSSGLPSTSGLMGRNLMDHPYLLAWGLLPGVAGTYRGTQSTGGIDGIRSGSFRRNQAAFRIDIHNDGWGWATGSPYSDLLEYVDHDHLIAGDLRRSLADRLSRQLLLAFMVELLPERYNRVTVDPQYLDAIGNPRPVIDFSLPDYSKAGLAYGRSLSESIFKDLKVCDRTKYDPDDYGYFSFNGNSYVFRGGNHFAGTHIMGNSKADSVVDSWQRSWDHDNLYMVGGGSMCSIGTANTTLTLAALSFRSVERILDQLDGIN